MDDLAHLLSEPIGILLFLRTLRDSRRAGMEGISSPFKRILCSEGLQEEA